MPASHVCSVFESIVLGGDSSDDRHNGVKKHFAVLCRAVLHITAAYLAPLGHVRLWCPEATTSPWVSPSVLCGDTLGARLGPCATSRGEQRGWWGGRLGRWEPCCRRGPARGRACHRGRVMGAVEGAQNEITHQLPEPTTATLKGALPAVAAARRGAEAVKSRSCCERRLTADMCGVKREDDRSSALMTRGCDLLYLARDSFKKASVWAIGFAPARVRKNRKQLGTLGRGGGWSWRAKISRLGLS